MEDQSSQPGRKRGIKGKKVRFAIDEDQTKLRHLPPHTSHKNIMAGNPAEDPITRKMSDEEAFMQLKPYIPPAPIKIDKPMPPHTAPDGKLVASEQAAQTISVTNNGQDAMPASTDADRVREFVERAVWRRFEASTPANGSPVALEMVTSGQDLPPMAIERTQMPGQAVLPSLFSTVWTIPETPLVDNVLPPSTAAQEIGMLRRALHTSHRLVEAKDEQLMQLATIAGNAQTGYTAVAERNLMLREQLDVEREEHAAVIAALRMQLLAAEAKTRAGEDH